MSAIDAAFPFVEVKINPPPPPTAQRAPGVLAIVGKSGAGPVSKPTVISESAEIDAFRAGKAENDLSRALTLALNQNPRPSTIYAVGVDATSPKYDEALASLGGLDDITFVTIANTPAPAGATQLAALKTHVENLSSDGNKQMAVVMADTTSIDDPATLAGKVAALKSDQGRVILVAARGATVTEGTKQVAADVAAAAAAAIAGHRPHISIALKPVAGFSIPRESRYSATEIKALTKLGITPIIDPALLVGEGLFFADARTFDKSGGQFNMFVDGVRVLDDVEFKLKAGLIGMIGDARITKVGMTLVKARADAILETLVLDGEIDTYTSTIPVLDALNLPETARSQPEKDLITKCRQNRAVDMFVTIFYGPAVHRLVVTLNPKM